MSDIIVTPDNKISRTTSTEWRMINKVKLYTTVTKIVTHDDNDNIIYVREVIEIPEVQPKSHET